MQHHMLPVGWPAGAPPLTAYACQLLHGGHYARSSSSSSISGLLSQRQRCKQSGPGRTEPSSMRACAFAAADLQGNAAVNPNAARVALKGLVGC